MKRRTRLEQIIRRAVFAHMHPRRMPDVFTSHVRNGGKHAPLEARMKEGPEGSKISSPKSDRLLNRNANRIVGGVEFRQAEADGRTVWQVVGIKPTPLTPLPRAFRTLAAVRQ